MSAHESKTSRWLLALAMALFVTLSPYVYFRIHYGHAKRLRVVERGVFYRCGQLTEAGFTDAVLQLGIRTIINAQDDVPDPDLAKNWFNSGGLNESELCRQLGVRYVHLPPDLVPRCLDGQRRPQAIDRFLTILDDPANHPVLLHCRAGLHRTGVLCATYRMEFQGWTPQEAILELKAHGFGEFFCTSANDYVLQYVLRFQPGQRPPGYSFPEPRFQARQHALFPEPRYHARQPHALGLFYQSWQWSSRESHNPCHPK